jgi:hypothetical protein
MTDVPPMCSLRSFAENNLYAQVSVVSAKVFEKCNADILVCD